MKRISLVALFLWLLLPCGVFGNGFASTTVARGHLDDLLLVVLTGTVAGLIFLGILLWNQRKLKDTEAGFRALSEASFGGIVIHENGVILECNDSLSQLSGYSRAELIGSNLLTAVVSGFQDLVRDNIRSGFSQMYEVEGMRKDGTRFPVGVRGKNIPYQGRTVRVTELLDLTGQKAAEDRTRKAKQQYDTLVAKLPVGVYILRAKSDGSLSFDFVSPPMARMLGVPVQRILDDYRCAFEQIHPDDLNSFVQLYTEKIPLQKPFEWEGRFRQDESVQWIRLSCLPDPQPDGDVLWHGLMVDITERRQSEDRIRTLLEEKDLVLKEVHHRIKNNMSTITGLLTLQAATLNDPGAVAALEDAKGRVLSMMVLYDKLYLSSDNQGVSLAVYLPALVEEVLGNFPNIGLVTFSTQAEDIVLGAQDLSSLGMIVNELLTNIMKYAFTGRSTGSIRVSATQKAEKILLTIQDDGCGLPEDFDLAQPVGFGLTLVDLLAKHLKGTLSIERKDGCLFILEFPGPTAQEGS